MHNLWTHAVDNTRESNLKMDALMILCPVCGALPYRPCVPVAASPLPLVHPHWLRRFAAGEVTA